MQDRAIFLPLSILLIILFGATVTADPIHILRIGGWYGEKPRIDAGQDWWGIFPDSAGYLLQQSPVTLSIIDESAVDPEGGVTRVFVEIPQEKAPLLLVHGLDNPIAGPLESAKLLPPIWPADQSSPPKLNGFLFPGQSLRLSLESQEIRLVAIGTVEEAARHHDSVISNYYIVVKQDMNGYTVSQKLAVIPRLDNIGRPHLVWAGDLDRDGKIDLLYNFTEHYTATRFMLYLSTAAEEGQLVGLVAVLNTAGC